MIAKEFPEVNLRIAEHQDEYETLPAYHDREEGSLTFCFHLNKEEIDQIVRTGEIYFKQLTYVAMSSSGLIRKYYRMSRNLINNNNITVSTDTAITYSLCCAIVADY